MENSHSSSHKKKIRCYCGGIITKEKDGHCCPSRFVSAQNRNRTSDTRIFSPLLYRLSYLGLSFHTTNIIHNTKVLVNSFFTYQRFYIPTVLHYQRFYIPTGNQWKRETQIKNGLPALGEAHIIMPEQIPYRFQSRPRNTYFRRDLRIWLQHRQCRLPVPYRLPDQEQSRRC